MGDAKTGSLHTCMQNYQIAHLTMHQVGLTIWARKIH